MPTQDFQSAIVNPGDIVLGDDDGMVIVDRSNCDEIYANALKRVEKEVQKAELLKSGKTSVELDRLDAKFKALGLNED